MKRRNNLKRKRELTIANLLRNIKKFRNIYLEVRLSVDGGQTSRPISDIWVLNDYPAVILYFDLDTWNKFYSEETRKFDYNCPSEVYEGMKIPDFFTEFQQAVWKKKTVYISVDNMRTVFPIEKVVQRGVRCILIGTQTPSVIFAQD